MIVWIVSVSIFAIEFLVKYYLKTNLADQSIPLIKNVLHLTVVFNTGAAFGILKGAGTLLIYTSLIFIIILIVMLKENAKRDFFDNLAFGLIMGGALSNLFDRIAYGFVIDYIDIRIWPVFNISDTCISIGVGILIIKSLKKHEKKLTCF